jgi:hypothetical protein
MRIIYVLTLLLVQNACLHAQVTFSAFPKNKQLYPRKLSGPDINKGLVKFTGSVQFFPSTSYLIKKFRYAEGDNLAGDGTYLESFNLPVNGAFDITDKIPAERANYRYQLFKVVSGTETAQTTEAREVVAGDAFIVNGQSNAASQAFDGDAQTPNASNFIRTFGDMKTSSYNRTDWFIARGDGYDYSGYGNPNNFIQGHIGQWGIRMARLLLDQFNVPICILNGAFTGADISYFLKTRVASEEQNNYLRMYTRIENADLKESVRGIFWFQGESDGIFDYPDYKLHLSTLHDDWKADYPGLEKVFIFQIKAGCWNYSQQQINQHLRIQQDQRSFADEQADVVLIGTNHIQNGPDNCHYVYSNGYEKIGLVASSYVSKELNNAVVPANAFSPQPVQAYQSAPGKIQLVLDQPGENITIDAGYTNNVRLEGGGTYTVTGLSKLDNGANQHVIVIDYTKSDPGDPNPTGITAWDVAGSNLPGLYNSNGLGLVSFENFAVFEAPLPLKFGYLQAIKKNDGAEINWEVLNNEIYSIYEIQHSTDARSWEKAGLVSAKNGAVGQYTFFESGLPSGKVYYRIKGVKKDGDWDYSTVLSITGSGSATEFSVYPNPLESNSMIRFRKQQAGRVQLSLFNLNGRQLASRSYDLRPGEQFIPVPMAADLATGIYMLKITDGERVYQQKLVKNR